MNKPTSPASSVALRVATAMYQMGIDGLPRNYELVYEAYSGANPELAREFVALGKVKTQRALDELGRKYLPHHHEEGVLSKTNERMRDQMTAFMNILEEEKSSLGDYGRIIGEASKTFLVEGELDREALTKSIQELSQATERQVTKSEAMAAVVQTQAQELNDVKNEIDNFEKMKFIDQLTGLGNRRAFNKAIAKVYANSELPMLCGLAYGEIDDFKRFTENGDTVLGDHFVRHIGHLIMHANTSGDFAARLDGSRFAFLFNTGDDREIMRLVDALRRAASSKPLINPKNGRNLGTATLSVGIAMSEVAGNPGQLMAYAEQAMNASMKAGGNRSTLFSTSAPVAAPKDWMIYRP